LISRSFTLARGEKKKKKDLILNVIAEGKKGKPPEKTSTFEYIREEKEWGPLLIIRRRAQKRRGERLKLPVGMRRAIPDSWPGRITAGRGGGRGENVICCFTIWPRRKTRINKKKKKKKIGRWPILALKRKEKKGRSARFAIPKEGGRFISDLSISLRKKKRSMPLC